MNTNHYHTISILNLYKGCHKDKSFDDVKKFRQYMKKQAEKGHNGVHASIHYMYDSGYTHTHWCIVMYPTTI